MNDPTPPQWFQATLLSDPKTGIGIRVNVSELPPKFEGAIPIKHYSLELVRVLPNGNTSRFFPMVCTVTDGIVSIVPFASGRFAALVDEAEEWVRNERQKREDAVARQRSGR